MTMPKGDFCHFHTCVSRSAVFPTLRATSQEVLKRMTTWECHVLDRRVDRYDVTVFFTMSKMCDMRVPLRPCEATRHVREASAEHSMNLDHRFAPNDPLEAAHGRPELPNYATLASSKSSKRWTNN